MNPVDVARTFIMLRLNMSALFGYTGAVFKKYFGSGAGIYVSILILHLWIIVPSFFASKKFERKDF